MPNGPTSDKFCMWQSPLEVAIAEVSVVCTLIYTVSLNRSHRMTAEVRMPHDKSRNRDPNPRLKRPTDRYQATL